MNGVLEPVAPVTQKAKSGGASNAKKPLLFGMREVIGGKSRLNPQLGPTYIGSTACPGTNGVPDYDKD